MAIIGNINKLDKQLAMMVKDRFGKHWGTKISGLLNNDR